MRELSQGTSHMDDSTLKTVQLLTASSAAGGAPTPLRLEPAFSRRVLAYEAVDVPSSVSAITVSATATESDAFVQVLRATGGATVPLAIGPNEVGIRCEAADGSSSTTVVRVVRPSRKSGQCDVSRSILRAAVDSVDIAFFATDPAATVSRPNSVNNLNTVDTLVKCEVKSADGSSSSIYSVRIRKDGSGNVDLTCTTTCGKCQRKVRTDRKAAHESLLCPELQDHKVSGAATGPYRPSDWEKALADRKSAPSAFEACVKAAEASKLTYLTSVAGNRDVRANGGAPTDRKPPDLGALKEVRKLAATALSLAAERSPTNVDAGLHRLLAWAVEELMVHEHVFGGPGGGAKAMGGGQPDENAAAADSFMQDEVEGLLLSLGVAPTASGAAQLKAMDAEYHRLLDLGRSDQAAEVQGLYLWKTKQLAGSGTTEAAGGMGGHSELRGSFYEAMGRALEKYSLGGDEDSCALLSSTSPPPSDALAYSTSVLSEAWETHISETWKRCLGVTETSSRHEAPIAEPLSLSGNFYSPMNPFFPQLPLALARGLAWSGSPFRAACVLLDFLARAPADMAALPRQPRSDGTGAHATTLHAVFRARTALLDVAPAARAAVPSDHILHTLDTASMRSLCPAAFACLCPGTSATGTTTAACDVLRDAAEVVAVRSPGPRELAFAARAGLAHLEAAASTSKPDAAATALDDIVRGFEAARRAEDLPPTEISSPRRSELAALTWFMPRVDRAAALCPKPQTQPPQKPQKAQKPQPKQAATTARPAPAAAASRPSPQAPSPAAATKQVPAKPAGKAAAGKPAPARAPPPQQQPQQQPPQQRPKHQQPEHGAASPPAASSSTHSLNAGRAAPHHGAATTAPAAKRPPATTRPAMAPAPAQAPGKSAGSQPDQPEPAAPAERVFDTRLGLARALARKAALLNGDGGSSAAGAAAQADAIELLRRAEACFREAIALRPACHDAYIELAFLVEHRLGNIAAAIDVYRAFPCAVLPSQAGGAAAGAVAQDDLFIVSELSRLIMKEK
ncbi:hypothetical protein HK405_015667, partial [Cladochytrium tenue]